MDIKTIQGNIVDEAEFGGYDVILHNCNCQRRMGSGVARSIAEAWPEAAAADQNTPISKSKLGTFSKATIERGDVVFDVYNLYGQWRYGPHWERHFDLAAFNLALEAVAEDLKDTKRPMNILFPPMGAGSAGGNWNAIVSAILTHLGQHNLTLITLPRRRK